MALQDNNTPKRNKHNGTVLEKYLKSFFHAIDGIVYCIKYEHNIIIILAAIIVAVFLGLIFNIESYEWLFVLSMCGFISAMEMVNSSIEATIDLAMPEEHPLAKIAKDTASAATLILCIVALIGGIIIFLPKIMGLL